MAKMSESKYRERYGAAYEFIMAQKKKRGKYDLPWNRAYCNIRSRCQYKGDPRWSYYGGRGLKCEIGPADLKKLFYRDRAWELNRPSVDRIDSSRGYSIDNVRWIELAENQRMKWFHDPIKKKQFKIIAGEFFKSAIKYGWGHGLSRVALMSMLAAVRGDIQKSGTQGVIKTNPLDN